MNEHNLPMMLPNGQIFGQLVRLTLNMQKIGNVTFIFILLLFQALSQISKDNGVIICPKTNRTFQQPKIEKVFVM